MGCGVRGVGSKSVSVSRPESNSSGMVGQGPPYKVNGTDSLSLFLRAPDSRLRTPDSKPLDIHYSALHYST